MGFPMCDHMNRFELVHLGIPRPVETHMSTWTPVPLSLPHLSCSLGDALLNLFKFVQYAAHTSFDKWAVSFQLKGFLVLFFLSFQHSREFDPLPDVNSCFHIDLRPYLLVHGCSINTINTDVISYPYCWDRMLLRDELSRKQCFFILPMEAQ